MNNLPNKVAFITGGASGIGLGLAKVFSEAGMKIVIADVRQDHLDTAMQFFQAANREVHAIRLDVADRKQVAAAADETVRVFGKVHLVCNNAGVSIFGPMEAATYEDWEWLMNVNFWGVVNGCQEFIPKLRAHGEGGHIVNTASMAGFITGPGMGIYCASKFAVRGLTESLRYDLAPHGIGVSMLSPGFVRSNIHEAVHTRPQSLANTGYHVDAEQIKRLDHVLSVGMDPVDVGRAVLRGIQRNDFYIFPHAEFKDEMRELCDDILDALPNGAPDPARMQMEDGRRARRAEMAKLIAARKS